MPFTPFHLGPALLLGILLFNFIDFPTLIIASIVNDIEPISVLLFGLSYPLHGFFHSFLGATILAVAVSSAIFNLRGQTKRVMSFLELRQKQSGRSILLSSFLGTYSHVVLDSSLGYRDIQPLFPFAANPFYNPLLAGFVVYLCVFSFALGAALYLHRITGEKQES